MCDYYEKSYFCQTMHYQVYLKINKSTVKNNVFFFFYKLFPLIMFWAHDYQNNCDFYCVYIIYANFNVQMLQRSHYMTELFG